MSLRPTHQLCPRISSGHASARATHQVGASLKPAHASPRPTRISSAHASALPTNQFCPRISLVHAREPGPRISLIRGSYGPGPSISQLRPPFDLDTGGFAFHTTGCTSRFQHAHAHSKQQYYSGGQPSIDQQGVVGANGAEVERTDPEAVQKAKWLAGASKCRGKRKSADPADHPGSPST